MRRRPIVPGLAHGRGMADPTFATTGERPASRRPIPAFLAGFRVAVSQLIVGVDFGAPCARPDPGAHLSGSCRCSARRPHRRPKLTDNDIEAAEAMLANPDIGMTRSHIASASHPQRSIATFPLHDPRNTPAYERSCRPPSNSSPEAFAPGIQLITCGSTFGAFLQSPGAKAKHRIIPASGDPQMW